jgi:hypothetical protein
MDAATFYLKLLPGHFMGWRFYPMAVTGAEVWLAAAWYLLDAAFSCVVQ